MDEQRSGALGLTSPACGGGRAEGAGGGSRLLGALASGDTLFPTLSRKRERERTALWA